MKRKNKKIKIAAVLVLLLFIGTSAVQAVVLNDDERAAIKLEEENTISVLGTSSSFTWEDDFLDSTKIDMDKSENIDVAGGKVVIKNTYKAWHYPWPKMKVITIQNSGGAKDNYVLFLERVAHESEMESDYSDIRFVNVVGSNVYDLDYWVGTDYDQYYADIWVRVKPEVPSGTSKIYMFYGDDSAPSYSNFDMIFKWDDRTDPDIMCSYKNELEGAWDPDVEFGSGRFLVAWEERLGPEDLPSSMERAVYCVIHGRSYDEDGGNPRPSGDADINIRVQTGVHAENPSIAYGSGKFLVVWEENPATIGDRFEADIKGSLVTLTSSGGTASSAFTISSALSLQCDPCVAYGNSRYFVVWEDARAGTNNYDVWGRIYDSSGNPKTSEFRITSDPNCQAEAWVCADDNGGFMVVYESGANPETGPFSLYAQGFDSNGNSKWGPNLVASGSSSTDNVFPSAAFNPTNAGRYFIAWNDGDYSSSDWRGNVWGKTLNQNGNTQYSNFKVQSGDHYIRTDVKPFLGDMFIVTYDGSSDLWGRLVYSDSIQTNARALSDGSSLNIDWNNIAVSDNGRVMAVWEDERDVVSEYADAFGSVWHIYKSGASSDISTSFSSPKSMTTEAVLVSDVISDADVQQWERFDAIYEMGYGSISFKVMNSQGTSTLYTGLGDISEVSVVPIRLKATFSRSRPDTELWIDKWSVDYVGIDLDPPETHLTKNPSSPDGSNGWYKSPVEISLLGLDGEGSGVDTINYKLDGGTTQTSHNNPFKFTIWNSGAHSLEYWSVDFAGNTEPHKTESGIKIDSSEPVVDIIEPDEFEVPAGDILVKATVNEDESGIQKVQFLVNGEVKDETTSTQDPYLFSFYGAPGMFYSIVVKAYDNAGSFGADSVDVQTTPEDRNYDYTPKIGYYYTASGTNDNLLLLALSCSLVIANELNVKIRPPDSIGTVDHVKFSIRGRTNAEGTEYAPDNDGYFKYNFDPPTWFYTVTATMYNSNGGVIEEFQWPGRVLFINSL